MAKKTRFQLRSDETAQENLWRAIAVATLYLLKRRQFYGLVFETRQELIDTVMMDTYDHFIKNKVIAHGYDRRFPFINNVLSSCWSVAHKAADRIIKQMDFVVHTEDVHHPYYQDTLPTQAGFPGYLAQRECYSYRHVPLSQVRMDFYVQTIKEEYETQKEEALEMGVTPPTWEAWLTNQGYTRDADLMVWLEEDDKVRRKTIARIRRHPELAEKFPRTYQVNYKLGRKRKNEVNV
jgi:hypothetical protein